MANKEVNKPLYRNVNGEKVQINPFTKSVCVTMSDGRTLEEVIRQIEEALGISVQSASPSSSEEAETEETQKEVI